MSSPGLSAAGLFAGIGGIERGLERAGHRTEMLCEWWEPAKAVLRERHPGVPLQGDVTEVRSLPAVDLVAAGFPCTDLSQAGRTKGITGEASGLVTEVFRLLRKSKRPTLLIENVRNMLVLDGGTAMRYLIDELEDMNYRWAYRLVDSRFTGVPQRRQRVIVVASRTVDPAAVLFADDAGERSDIDSSGLNGFYWTEGERGLGWGIDAVPTLKGGSTIGIPSQPAMWNPDGELGRRLLMLDIESGERLQGFDAGWTEPAGEVDAKRGTRWKLVGNAVTVGVSTWVGERLRSPGEIVCASRAHDGARWPLAAYGGGGEVFAVDASMYPRHDPYVHLADLVDLDACTPLSARAAAGFLTRARRGSLNFVDGFLDDVAEHAAHQASELHVA